MIKKTRCPKNYALSEIEVADIVNVSVSYVKKVRSQAKPTNSVQAKTIQVIDELANKQKLELVENLKSL